MNDDWSDLDRAFRVVFGVAFVIMAVAIVVMFL